MAVTTAAGGADGDEHHLGAAHRLGQVAGEAQPAGADIARHQILQPRLIDRDLAAQQPFDLRLVIVDAHDRMAEFGKTGARHEPDIARADHRDAHEALILLKLAGRRYPPWRLPRPRIPACPERANGARSLRRAAIAAGHQAPCAEL